MYYWKAELVDVLAHADLTGFTYYLYWEEKRYVVRLTYNMRRSYDLLIAQIKLFKWDFKVLTLGGRQDPSNGNLIVDIGTASDDLEYALRLCKLFDQKCIYDSHRGVDVKP